MKDKIFTIIILLMTLLVSLTIFFRTEKEISINENRTLFKRSDIKFSNLNEDIEKYIQDQFIGGETLKEKYNKCKNYSVSLITKVLEKNNIMDRIPLGNNMYKLSNTDYLVYKEANLEEDKESYLRIIEGINNLNNCYPNINIYVYNIITDQILLNKKNCDVFIRNELNQQIKYMSSSNINNWEDYKRCFYKTDHHWCYKGQYEGYLDIAKFLEFDKIVEIEEEITFINSKFHGTKVKQIGDFSNYDVFTAYKYKFPDMKIKINNKQVEDYRK